MKKEYFKYLLVCLTWPCLLGLGAESEGLKTLRSAIADDWAESEKQTDTEFEASAKAQLRATYNESVINEQSIESMAWLLREFDKWMLLEKELDMATLESIYSDETLLKKVRGYAAMLLHFAKDSEVYALRAFQYSPNTMSVFEKVYDTGSVRYISGALDALIENRLEGEALQDHLKIARRGLLYDRQAFTPEELEAIFIIGSDFIEYYENAKKWDADIATKLVETYRLFEKSSLTPPLSVFLHSKASELTKQDFIALIDQYKYFADDEILESVLWKLCGFQDDEGVEGEANSEQKNQMPDSGHPAGGSCLPCSPPRSSPRRSTPRTTIPTSRRIRPIP